MFKYQLIFKETGEITESDYIYTNQYRAKMGALSFLRVALKYRDRTRDELVECKIFSQYIKKPLIYLGGKPMEVSKVLNWLQGKFDG